MRVGIGTERLAGGLRGRGSGHVRLEVAPPRTRALAPQPVFVDHKVPELRPATVKLPTDHETPAATRTESEHYHRLGIAAGSRTRLAERRKVCVVFHDHGKVESLG